MKEKKARDVMTRDVVTVAPDALITQAIERLLSHNVSCLPVVDADGNLQGIISEHDIMNFAFSGDAASTEVAAAMTRDVVTYGPDTDVAVLVNCCASRRIRRVPIVEGSRVVGIVSRRDILREMLTMYDRY